MAKAGSRGRLSGGEIAVVAVSVVLVLAFVIMMTTRLTGGEASAEPGATPTAPAATAAPSPTATQAPEGEDLSDVAFDFAAPSGNIACAIETDRALCGIASFGYADDIPAADVERCDGTIGHFLQVTAEGSSLVCDTSGQTLSIDAAGLPVLDYGQEQSARGFTCASDETGMTCAHEKSGYSFSVRRAAYDLS
ncbi:hypothetical protein [Georgenia sp. AZ-5]|uniref:hypothetical protein n=1 Tax=Georgenia sp. AZ-5 TaxID=3367526 RepID=UPI003754C6B3